MTDVATHFVGSIPEHYDRFLGPRISAGYANDLAAITSAIENKLGSSMPLQAVIIQAS